MKRGFVYIIVWLLPVALQVSMHVGYATIKKDDQTSTRITVTANIAKGYFVYADDDGANGLTKLAVSAEGLAFNSAGIAVKRYDNLFKKAYGVYTGNVVFMANIAGGVPASVKITLKVLLQRIRALSPLSKQKISCSTALRPMARRYSYPTSTCCILYQNAGRCKPIQKVCGPYFS